MKLLFVAFEFPPLNTGGVQRSMKFATYLREYGIEPIVITTNGGDGFENPFLDEQLEKHLPNHLQICRVPCLSLVLPRRKLALWFKTFFSLTDPLAKLWKPYLDLRLPEIIETHKPQAIYVSIPPFSMAPLWMDYAARYRLPLIVDFRDPWSQWQAAPFRSRVHYELIKRLEARVIKSSSAVVCVSEQVRTDLLRTHPEVESSKVCVITNGFDVEIEDWSVSSPHWVPDRKFEIGYVGAFYYNPVSQKAIMDPWWRRPPQRMLHYVSHKEDWLYRSPYFFFRAVRFLLESHPYLENHLRIRFAGNKPDWIDGFVSQFGLQDVVQFMGMLTHDAALEFQSTCDCLLITSAKVIGGRDYCIAGKTFEYFANRKPILGFVTEGSQRDILEQSGLAIICDPDNPVESAQKMLQMLQGNVKLTPNSEFLSGLHRKNLTSRLATVIKAVANDVKSI